MGLGRGGGMQAAARLGRINPSRPHRHLPHTSPTFYDSTVEIKGGSCILGCLGSREAGGLRSTGGLSALGGGDTF